MHDLQLWLLVLIAGAILVVIYTLLVKAVVKDPETTWLSSTTWLLLHFISGLFLGVFLPNPTIQMAGFITVWEISEQILGTKFPEYFAEDQPKAVNDVFITTAGYALGQWLRSRLTGESWRFC